MGIFCFRSSLVQVVCPFDVWANSWIGTDCAEIVRMLVHQVTLVSLYQ